MKNRIGKQPGNTVRQCSFLLLVLVLAACQQLKPDKTYQYIEIVEEEGFFGSKSEKDKEMVELKAPNDSTAYLEAFKKFCISMKVSQEMAAALGKVYSTPVHFKLLNDAGEDIAGTVTFPRKELREAEIAEHIFSMDTGIKESIGRAVEGARAEALQEAKIDSAKVKELEKLFSMKKDEFSNNNVVWYEPKSAPKYVNRNGIYCYFQTENGRARNLRFKVQYYADDWLFFDRIQFSIDDKAYEYIPSKVDTDHGNGKIWEWCDEQLTIGDKEFIYALSQARSAKMKLIGRQYYDIKKVSLDQILNIKRTLELYNALGGNY